MMARSGRNIAVVSTLLILLAVVAAEAASTARATTGSPSAAAAVRTAFLAPLLPPPSSTTTSAAAFRSERTAARSAAVAARGAPSSSSPLAAPRSRLLASLPCAASSGGRRRFSGLVSPLRATVEADGEADISSSSSDAAADSAEMDASDGDRKRSRQSFDLTTALFCGALAFDAYAEPAANSTRWEKGSRGLNVAFLSPAYTRNLYKGLVQIEPLRCTDLPDEEDTAEAVMTGGGVDAYLSVGIVEGQWEEDLKVLGQEYHNGVRDLRGCAHVGRSTTAWSNVDERKGKAKRRRGESGAYHIESSWGKGGQAVWEGDPPFYLYVQDPSECRLVFTVIDDDLIGEGQVIGSASRRLSAFVPAVKEKDSIKMMKNMVLAKIKSGELDVKNGMDLAKGVVMEWEGDIKLTHKPKKKDKNGQIAKGAMVGAAVAGPMGAAVGGLMASMYEGEVRGKIQAKLRYLPIPSVDVAREKYRPTGGLPGVNWSDLYERHIESVRSILPSSPDDAPGPRIEADDAEFCFFVNHDETGCSCAVYRSLEKQLIAISFRGTCVPKDLVTDASIVQDAWVEGEDVKDDGVAKVHAGFRNSLDSIVRRLKELVLAAVAPGEDLSQYDVIVTGHSLGAALATLFTADIAEYGMDAGRSLPQLEPSEPWWNSLASTFTGGKKISIIGAAPPPPPRPKSLKMYNFGSPRVGNEAFVAKFQSLMDDGRIDEAYRIVNGEDIIARGPRSMNGAFLGKISYEHSAPTVLISPPPEDGGGEQSVLWVEGESSNEDCPVRDGVALTSPLAEGNLLGDLVKTVQDATASDRTIDGPAFTLSALGSMAEKVGGRLQNLKADDLTTVLGIDKKYTEREVRMIQSIFSGQALSHHLEDEYYKGMGQAVGYVALVGEELRPIDSLSKATVVDMAGKLERRNVESQAESLERDVEVWDAALKELEKEEAA